MYSNKDLYYFIMNKVYSDKNIKNRDAIIDFKNGTLKYFEFIDRIEERAEFFKCIVNDVLAIDTKNDLELLVSILAGWASNKTLFLLSQLISNENKLTMLEEAGITCIIGDKIYKKPAIKTTIFVIYLN